MPSRRVHRSDAKTYGYSDKVNQVIDAPFLWLGGKHRVLFHDPLTAMDIGRRVDPVGGAFGGFRHVLLDQTGSSSREARQVLEMMAATKPREGVVKVVWVRPKKYKILRIG